MNHQAWEYNQAQAWAEQASDNELLAEHARLRGIDSNAIRMGGHGLIDDPTWNEVKREMRRRRMEIPGYPSYR